MKASSILVINVTLRQLRNVLNVFLKPHGSVIYRNTIKYIMRVSCSMKYALTLSLTLK